MKKKVVEIFLVTMVIVMAGALILTNRLARIDGVTIDDLYYSVSEASREDGFMATMKVLSYDPWSDTLDVVIDGKELTLIKYKSLGCKKTFLCKEEEFAAIGDSYTAGKKGLIEFHKTSMFSKKFVTETKDREWVIMPATDPLTLGLVMIPKEMMPKVVEDITTWSETSTTIYRWTYPADWIGVVQNLSTGEIYYGEFGLGKLPLVENMNFMDLMAPEESASGFLHVENGQYYSQPLLFVSQSKPDLEMMQMAVDYLIETRPDFEYYGPGYICWFLQYYPRSNSYETMAEGRSIAKQYCGVYYTLDD